MQSFGRIILARAILFFGTISFGRRQILGSRAQLPASRKHGNFFILIIALKAPRLVPNQLSTTDSRYRTGRQADQRWCLLRDADGMNRNPPVRFHPGHSHRYPRDRQRENKIFIFRCDFDRTLDPSFHLRPLGAKHTTVPQYGIRTPW